jgi:hypothetical protein
MVHRRSATSRGDASTAAGPVVAVGITAHHSDSIEQLEPMPGCGDAKLLQVLVRQARENRLVYVILAEDRLVLAEAQAPEPSARRAARPAGCVVQTVWPPSPQSSPRCADQLGKIHTDIGHGFYWVAFRTSRMVEVAETIPCGEARRRSVTDGLFGSGGYRGLSAPASGKRKRTRKLRS